MDIKIAQQITITELVLENQKLKQERDEARVAIRALAEHGESEIQRITKERDEARDALKEWQTLCLWVGTPEHIHDFIKGQQTRIHEAQDIEKTCERLERERDEAREQVKELIYIAGRAIDLAEIDFENDKFGIVSELQDGLKKIKEETK